MITMTRSEFEDLVAQALDSLPPDIARHMSNIEVVVANWPTRRQLRSSNVPAGQTLLGLYEGIPLTQRGAHYHLVLPDKITLFQGPILAQCHTREEVMETVRRTVIHEIAHHFGLSDDRLRELGAY
jgi:predicted Zn-dependent protease with MMP-like domain